MNFCPAPSPTSIGYLAGTYSTGIELDPTSVCPAIYPSQRGLQPSIDPPRQFSMDLTLSDITHAVGIAFGGFVVLLGSIATPLSWVLRGCVWIIKPCVLAVWSVFSAILRLAISPLFIPWRLAVWFYDVSMDIYEELEPLLLFFSYAIIIGLISGVIIAMLTTVIGNVVHSWISGDARRRQQRRPQSHRRRNRQATHQPSQSPAALREQAALAEISKHHRNKPATPALTPGGSSSSDEAPYLSHPRTTTSSGRHPRMTSAIPPSAAVASIAKGSSRFRAPPVGVRVGDTIHEEESSSGLDLV